MHTSKKSLPSHQVITLDSNDQVDQNFNINSHIISQNQSPEIITIDSDTDEDQISQIDDIEVNFN